MRTKGICRLRGWHISSAKSPCWTTKVCRAKGAVSKRAQRKISYAPTLNPSRRSQCANCTALSHQGQPCSPVPVSHQQEDKVGDQTFTRLPFLASWNMTNGMGIILSSRCILSHALFWTAEFGGNRRTERGKKIWNLYLDGSISHSLSNLSHNRNTTKWAQ